MTKGSLEKASSGILAGLALSVSGPAGAQLPTEVPHTRINATQAEQLRWLVDRAEISDLILRFERSIDDHNQAAYASTFTEDGELDLPFTHKKGRAAIAASDPIDPKNASHHISTNHMITIDGDRATARAYLIATHVFDRADRMTYAQAGGWYDFDLTRTPDGWRFSHVKLSVVWQSADMMKAPAPQRK
jgi:hypothetical protein